MFMKTRKKMTISTFVLLLITLHYNRLYNIGTSIKDQWGDCSQELISLFLPATNMEMI